MGFVSSLIKAINATGDSQYGSTDGQYMGYNIYPLNKLQNRPQSESEKIPQPELYKKPQLKLEKKTTITIKDIYPIYNLKKYKYGKTTKSLLYRYK